MFCFTFPSFRRAIPIPRFPGHNAAFEKLMILQYNSTKCPCSISSPTSRVATGYFGVELSLKFPRRTSLGCLRRSRSRAVRASNETKNRNGSGKRVPSDGDSTVGGFKNKEERLEWRKKIKEVLASNPQVESAKNLDPQERRNRLQKLLAKYPLVVEEEDPNWPESADGRGFNMDQFMNKLSIKNKQKDDDENDDDDKKFVWRDDDYIRPIKDIKTAEWDETVFKDISPLIVLESENCRDELEKAVNIIWNCRHPSPRCVAIDAVVECDLVSSLKVSSFPELIFTKAGKVLYREKAKRSADELSKMMAFFYYGAGKPPFFHADKNGSEAIPPAPASRKQP
ncbi:Thioredoxin-like fold domain-containing protein [Drosera capensis]